MEDYDIVINRYERLVVKYVASICKRWARFNALPCVDGDDLKQECLLFIMNKYDVHKSNGGTIDDFQIRNYDLHYVMCKTIMDASDISGKNTKNMKQRIEFTLRNKRGLDGLPQTLDGFQQELVDKLHVKQFEDGLDPQLRCIVQGVSRGLTWVEAGNQIGLTPYSMLRRKKKLQKQLSKFLEKGNED